MENLESDIPEYDNLIWFSFPWTCIEVQQKLPERGGKNEVPIRCHFIFQLDVT